MGALELLIGGGILLYALSSAKGPGGEDAAEIGREAEVESQEDAEADVTGGRPPVEPMPDDDPLTPKSPTVKCLPRSSRGVAGFGTLWPGVDEAAAKGGGASAGAATGSGSSRAAVAAQAAAAVKGATRAGRSWSWTKKRAWSGGAAARVPSFKDCEPGGGPRSWSWGKKSYGTASAAQRATMGANAKDLSTKLSTAARNWFRDFRYVYDGIETLLAVPDERAEMNPRNAWVDQMSNPNSQEFRDFNDLTTFAPPANLQYKSDLYEFKARAELAAKMSEQFFRRAREIHDTYLVGLPPVADVDAQDGVLITLTDLTGGSKPGTRVEAGVVSRLMQVQNLIVGVQHSVEIASPGDCQRFAQAADIVTRTRRDYIAARKQAGVNVFSGDDMLSAIGIGAAAGAGVGIVAGVTSVAFGPLAWFEGLAVVAAGATIGAIGGLLYGGYQMLSDWWNDTADKKRRAQAMVRQYQKNVGQLILSASQCKNALYSQEDSFKKEIVLNPTVWVPKQGDPGQMETYSVLKPDQDPVQLLASKGAAPVNDRGGLTQIELDTRSQVIAYYEGKAREMYYHNLALRQTERLFHAAYVGVPLRGVNLGEDMKDAPLAGTGYDASGALGLMRLRAKHTVAAARRALDDLIVRGRALINGCTALANRIAEVQTVLNNTVYVDPAFGVSPAQAVGDELMLMAATLNDILGLNPDASNVKHGLMLRKVGLDGKPLSLDPIVRIKDRPMLDAVGHPTDVLDIIESCINDYKSIYLPRVIEIIRGARLACGWDEGTIQPSGVSVDLSGKLNGLGQLGAPAGAGGAPVSSLTGQTIERSLAAQIISPNKNTGLWAARQGGSDNPDRRLDTFSQDEITLWKSLALPGAVAEGFPGVQSIIGLPWMKDNYAAPLSAEDLPPYKMMAGLRWHAYRSLFYSPGNEAAAREFAGVGGVGWPESLVVGRALFPPRYPAMFGVSAEVGAAIKVAVATDDLKAPGRARIHALEDEIYSRNPQNLIGALKREVRQLGTDFNPHVLNLLDRYSRDKIKGYQTNKSASEYSLVLIEKGDAARPIRTDDLIAMDLDKLATDPNYHRPLALSTRVKSIDKSRYYVLTKHVLQQGLLVDLNGKPYPVNGGIIRRAHGWQMASLAYDKLPTYAAGITNMIGTLFYYLSGQDFNSEDTQAFVPPGFRYTGNPASPTRGNSPREWEFATKFLRAWLSNFTDPSLQIAGVKIGNSAILSSLYGQLNNLGVKATGQRSEYDTAGRTTGKRPAGTNGIGAGMGTSKGASMSGFHGIDGMDGLGVWRDWTSVLGGGDVGVPAEIALNPYGPYARQGGIELYNPANLAGLGGLGEPIQIASGLAGLGGMGLGAPVGPAPIQRGVRFASGRQVFRARHVPQPRGIGAPARAPVCICGGACGHGLAISNCPCMMSGCQRKF